jgi:hypothetical protein
MDTENKFEPAMRDALRKQDIKHTYDDGYGNIVYVFYDEDDAEDLVIQLHNSMDDYGLRLGYEYEVDVDGCEVTVEEC